MIALGVFFQNCSTGLSVSSLSSSALPEGKTYVSYGKCGSDQIGVVAEIHFTDDYLNATLEREDCKDIRPSLPLDLKTISFAKSDSGKFVLFHKERIFDLQTALVGNPGQRVTRAYCSLKNGDPNSLAVLWNHANDPSQYSGFAAGSDWVKANDVLEFTKLDTRRVYRTRETDSDSLEITIDVSGGGGVKASDASGTHSVANLSCLLQDSPVFLRAGLANLFLSRKDSQGRPKFIFGERSETEWAPDAFFLSHLGTSDHLVYTYQNFLTQFFHSIPGNSFAVDLRTHLRWNEGMFFAGPTDAKKFEVRTRFKDQNRICIVRSEDSNHECVADWLGTLSTPDFPEMESRLSDLFQFGPNVMVANFDTLTKRCAYSDRDTIDFGNVWKSTSVAFSATDYQRTLNTEYQLEATEFKAYSQGGIMELFKTCSYLLNILKPTDFALVTEGLHYIYASTVAEYRTNYSPLAAFNSILTTTQQFVRATSATRDIAALIRVAVFEAVNFDSEQMRLPSPRLYSRSFMNPSLDLVSANAKAATCDVDESITLGYGGWRDNIQSCRQDQVTQAAVIMALSYLGTYLASTGECQNQRYGDMALTCAQIRDAILAGLAFTDRHLLAGNDLRQYPQGLGQGTPPMVNPEKMAYAYLHAFQFLNLLGVSDDILVKKDFDGSTVSFGDLRSRGINIIKYRTQQGISTMWIPIAAWRVNELVAKSPHP